MSRVNAQQPTSTGLSDEPNWGHPTKSQVRRDTTRAERVWGIVWLSIGALFGLFISVLYIGTRITIGDVHYPLPWTLLFAPWFNRAITKTALLWTNNLAIAAIPAAVWVMGFVILAAWPTLPFGGDTLVPSSMWAMLLLIAGTAGAVWPVLARLVTPAQQ